MIDEDIFQHNLKSVDIILRTIEANLLKSRAYITPDIHVPLFNPYMPELFYRKASN